MMTHLFKNIFVGLVALFAMYGLWLVVEWLLRGIDEQVLVGFQLTVGILFIAAFLGAIIRDMGGKW